MRFLIEFCTAKATQGSMGTVTDHALARNNYPMESNVLDHVKLDQVVATKAHSLREINFLEREYLVNFSGFLLIVRNPVDCILGNIPSKQIVGIEELIQRIEAEFEIWQGMIIKLIKTPMPVEIVNYSDLVSDSNESAKKVVESIYKLFHTEIDEDKYAELTNRLEKVKEISANVKGRKWNGVRSLNKGKCFYLRNIDPQYQGDVKNFFLTRLDYEEKWGEGANSINFELEREKFVRCGVIYDLVKKWKNDLDGLKFE